MHTLTRSILVLIAVTFAALSFAQGGIRAILWNYEPVVKSEDGTNVGFGYDQDLNDRLSLGLQFRSWLGSARGYSVEYRSAYHFSDNESSSFYMGPTIGMYKVKAEEGSTTIPLGFRIGVRGGLENFYADLHAGVKHHFGGGKAVLLSESGSQGDLLANTFCVGLDLGWGWAGKKR